MGLLRIDRKQDKRVAYAFTHKLADIPGGVTVSAKELTQKVLREGTPVGKGENGLYHVVKVAILHKKEASTPTAYQVEQGHNFKTGDIVMLGKNAKGYAITSIVPGDGYDTINVGTTLGNGEKGAAIYEADKTAASGVSFKYKPVALVGESYDVEALSNHVVNAWTIGQVKEANIQPVGEEVKAALTGIQFI